MISKERESRESSGAWRTLTKLWSVSVCSPRREGHISDLVLQNPVALSTRPPFRVARKESGACVKTKNALPQDMLFLQRTGNPVRKSVPVSRHLPLLNGPRHKHTYATALSLLVAFFALQPAGRSRQFRYVIKSFGVPVHRVSPSITAVQRLSVPP